eukprot:RCo031790
MHPELRMRPLVGLRYLRHIGQAPGLPTPGGLARLAKVFALGRKQDASELRHKCRWLGLLQRTAVLASSLASVAVPGPHYSGLSKLALLQGLGRALPTPAPVQ